MARYGPGQGEERSDASRAAGGGDSRGTACRTRGGDGDQEVLCPGRGGPFCETPAAAPPSEFSDAVAIQIPTQMPTSARKPYFIFGDAQNSVDLWFFDLADPSLFSSPAGEARTSRPNDTGDVTGAASYDQGEWSVIFKRPLRASAGAPFVPGEFLPIAFSVWDGFSRERGNRRGLTAWYSIYVEPQVVPSAIGPMVRTALIILVIELAVIGWVRWRNKQNARAGARSRAEPPGSHQSVSCRAIRRINVQEHLRSRR